jgi:plastocyanin
MKRLLSTALLSFVAATALAAGDEFTLTIKNHAFEPKEITLPAGKKIKLLVVNKDATPAEFESKPLGREKVIPGKASATINLGPLKPGRYSFVEEYHETEAAAQGTIIVQ